MLLANAQVGLIAPGYRAELVILDENFQVTEVIT
jgi:N-acetylglucosamine-6-phosphate deacetylase